MNHFTYFSILSGLLSDYHLKDTKLVDALFNTLFKLYQNTPIKALGDKSLIEKINDDYKINPPRALYIKQLTFPPTNWKYLYDEAMDYMRNRDFTNATMKFDGVFIALLDEVTTYHDIYRVYCNAGLAHLFSGNAILGVRCIMISKELNPNYTFAEEQLKKYQQKVYNPFIKMGTIKKMQKILASWQDRLHFKPEYLDFEIVCHWPEQKILNKLLEFGVPVDKQQFIEVANTVHSSDDLAAKLFDPYYDTSGSGSEMDEDFLWISAAALWNIYCPNEPEVKNLNDTIEKALNFSLNHSIREKNFDQEICLEYSRYLNIIKQFLQSDKEGFLKYWSTTFEYQTKAQYNLIDFLKDLVLHPDFETQTLELVDYLETYIPDDHWAVVKISSLVHKKDLGWEAIYSSLKRKNPFYCHFAYETAKIFEDAGDLPKAEQFFLESLQIIDSRKTNQVWDLETRNTTIYEDYQFILNELLEFYNMLTNITNRLNEISLESL
jgi:hypothetical protein